MPNKLNIVVLYFPDIDSHLLLNGKICLSHSEQCFNTMRIAAIQSSSPLSIWSDTNFSGTRKNRREKLKLISSHEDIEIFERLLVSDSVDIVFLEDNGKTDLRMLECAKRARRLLGDRLLIVLFGSSTPQSIPDHEVGHIIHRKESLLQKVLEDRLRLGLFDIIIEGHAEYIISALGEVAYQAKKSGNIRAFFTFLDGIKTVQGDWILSYIDKQKIVTIISDKAPFDNSKLKPAFTLFGVYSTSALFYGKPTAHIYTDVSLDSVCGCSVCKEAYNVVCKTSPNELAEKLLLQLQSAVAVIKQDYNVSGCALVEDPMFLFGSQFHMEKFCELLESSPVDIHFGIRMTTDSVLECKDILARLKTNGLDLIILDISAVEFINKHEGMQLQADEDNEDLLFTELRTAVIYLEKLKISSGVSVLIRSGNMAEANNDDDDDREFFRCDMNISYVELNNIYNPKNAHIKDIGQQTLLEVNNIELKIKGANFYPPKIRLETGDVYPSSGLDAIQNPQHFTQVGFPTLNSFEQAAQSLSSVYYGGIGGPADRKLAETIACMEGGNHAILTPTGHAAIAQAMCGLLHTGDHILVVDTAAISTKRFFCETYLPNFGVEIEYYSPFIKSNELEQMIKFNTKIIFLESPGSYTYDIQDLCTIVNVAKQMGIITIFDNTWSASKFLKPLDWGIDVVVLSLGKYPFAITGVSMGAIVTKDKELFKYLENKSLSVGNRVSQLDCQLAQKALTSLDQRLTAQQESSCSVAESLKQIEEIQMVIFPALKDFPQYNDWKRQYTGVNSLVTIKLQDLLNEHYTTSFLNYLASLGAIAIGDSYGGSFSLIKKINLNGWCILKGEEPVGQYLRLYIGHEHSTILINHIKRSFHKTSRDVKLYK
jgi:cystathionine beta-lyase